MRSLPIIILCLLGLFVFPACVPPKKFVKCTRGGDCPKCEGHNWYGCKTCVGNGTKSCEQCNSTGKIQSGSGAYDCFQCGGQGSYKCQTCGGDGRVECGEYVTVEEGS